MNLNEIMQQAQKLQGNLQQSQEKLKTLEVAGEAGAGLVKVVMNGKYKMKSINIDPSLLDDVEMLEDIVAAAINDCVTKVETRVQQEMSSFLPAGFNMPN